MAEEYTKEDRRTLLIATSFAVLITPLMSTMMNLSLLSIGDDFGIGSHGLAYVNTLFLLGSVVCMVPAARIASIKGMRKVFLSGLIMLMISCILAALSPNFYILLLMRFIIGFGSAMLMVTGLAMLTFVFPIENRGKVLGINTTFVYIGLSLGPTLGGILTDLFGWRSIFVFILVLSAISFMITSRFRKEVTPSPGDRMDFVGAVLWGMMIITLMFGIVNITQVWGMCLAGVGTVMLVITITYLSRKQQPVLNIRMFGNRPFSKACIAAFMNYGASYCITFFLSLYLQSIGELSATQAGTLMLVQPLMQVLITKKMGEVSDRMENKSILPALGMMLTGVGVAMYLLLDTSMNLPLVVAIMVITGLGLGTFSAPNTSIIMSSVEPRMKGEASGVVAVVRQTGMMVSMAIAMSCITIIMGSTDNLGPDTYGVFVDVIHTTFSICLVMCIIGILCSLRKVKEHSQRV